MDVTGIIDRYKREKARRALYDDTWQEIADFMLPSRASFTEKQMEGSNRRERIFDSTPEEAVESLAAGLHGMMTSRGQRWFYLAPQRAALSTNVQVKRWSAAVTEIMYSVFNSPASGFHTQIDQCYQDLSALGNCMLFTETTSPESPVVFQSRHMSKCCFATNFYGVVDTVFYSEMYPLGMVVKRFGAENLPDNLKRAYENGQSGKEVELLHAVMPRDADEIKGKIGSTSMPYGSYWILSEHKTLLSEGGYRDMPYNAARWRVRTGESYGTGPGERMLPEVRMLNEMYKTVMKAGQKALDPPLQVPDDTFIGPIRTRPSGLSYYRANSQAKIEPIESRHRVDIGIELLEMQRQLIRRGFFQDAFDITSDSDGVNVKATFTMQRRDDKFRRLSPVFSRLDSELLEPIIARVYSVLDAKGMLPPPPAVMENEGVRVEYISPVARAMRTAEADDLLRLLELAAPLAEIDPDASLNIDADKAVRVAGIELFNVPPEIMRSEAEVKRMREQRSEERQTEQALVSGQAAATALKDVSSAQQNFTSTG